MKLSTSWLLLCLIVGAAFYDGFYFRLVIVDAVVSELVFNWAYGLLLVSVFLSGVALKFR